MAVDAGQVFFSIRADGLDEVFGKVQSLNKMLGNLNGKSFTPFAGGKVPGNLGKGLEKAANGVGKVAKETKKLATPAYAKQMPKLVTSFDKMRDSISKLPRSDRMKALRGEIGKYGKVMDNLRHEQAKLGRDGDPAMKAYYSDLNKRYGAMKKIYSGMLNRDQQAIKSADAVAKANIKASNDSLKVRMHDAKVRQQLATQTENAEKRQGNIVSKSLKGGSQVMKDYNSLVNERTRAITNFGSRMQSLGGTLERVTSPFMSVFRGAAMGLGYRALGKVFESITGSFQRYDTMRTYAGVLGEMGIDATKKFKVGAQDAMTAYDNLEQSVLGLPTGVDEMVQSMRTYAGATGDVEKATKLAIAANNSYIAGQMDSRQQLFTQRQLISLAGGAELAATQWDSLRRNAPMAFRAVADELGISVKKMNDSLKSGEISGQKFLDVFIKVGTEGKISKAAQKMKQTWGAVSQNITNAFNRMGSGILDTLDSVFKKTTGRDFLQTVLGVDKNGNAVGGGIKDFIDGISKSIQDFIKANPTAVTDFFDKIRSIDWGGILQGYGDFIRTMGKAFVGLGKLIGGRGMISFMLWGNVVGKFIKGMGGLARGLAGPLAKIGMLFGGGKVAGGLKGLFGLGAGKAAVKAAKDMGKTGEAVAAASISWQGVASKAVTIAAIPAIAWSFKKAAEALKIMGSVHLSADQVANIGVVATGIGALMAVLSKVGTTLLASKWGAIGGGVATGMFMGIGKAVDWIGGGFKKGVEAIGMIAEMDVPDGDKVKDVVDRMNTLRKAFRSINPFDALGRLLDAMSIGAQGDAIVKISDAVGSIKKMGKTQLDKSIIDSAVKNISDTVSFARDLYKMFNKQEEFFAKMEEEEGRSKENVHLVPSRLKEQVTNFAESMQGVADSIEGIRGIVKNSVKLEKTWSTLTAESQEHPFDWAILKDRINNVADNLWELVGHAKGEDKDAAFDKLADVARTLKGQDFTKVTSMFNEIPKMLTSMNSAFKKLYSSSLFGDKKTISSPTADVFGFKPPSIEMSPLDILEQKLGELFGALGRIKAKIPEGATDFQSDMQAVNVAITMAGRIISKMNTLATENVAKDIDTGRFDTLGQAIGDFITKVKTPLGTDQGAFETNAQAFNKGLNYISNAMNKMSNMNFTKGARENVETAVGRLKRAINKIKTIKNPKPKKITVKVTSSVTGINAIANKITRHWKNVTDALGKVTNKRKDFSVTINGTVYDNIDSVVLKIGGINTQITNALSKIQTFYSKTIFISVNAVLSGATDILEQFGVGAATGGLITGAGKKPIYRALGGFAMRPRGTDTVPAMLTPGEYIMRRKAVDTFGARFFQSLNHLDLRSALNSISARAGQNSLPRTSTTINNRTINNTNKPNVTINNNGGGGVGLIRATKWAHGLA